MWKNFSLALLSLLLGSCAQPVGGPGGGLGGPPYLSSCLDGKIFELQEFDFAANGKTGQSGNIYEGPKLGAPVTNATILDDIHEAAFRNTPLYFQTEICKLTYLFVDPKLTGAETAGWGFWEGEKQVRDGVSDSFVGISPAIWSASPGKSLTQHKTSILASMLATAHVTTTVEYSSSNVNSRTVLLRAILAHEVGHILYRDGDVLNFDVPKGCKAAFDLTWDKAPASKPKKARRMLPFAYQAGKTSIGRRLDDIKKQPARAVEFLRETYETNAWASFLATSTPEEDFVETFTMAVLTGSGSQQVASLKIDFKDGKAPVDIAKVFLQSPTLQQKAHCFTRYVPPSRARRHL